MADKNYELIQKIQDTERQLLAKWSISQLDMKIITSHIEEKLSDILKEEIEAAQTIKILTNAGWYSFESPKHNYWNMDTLTGWCSSNCIGNYELFYHTCLFQNKEDATKFNLVWG